jgi:hypothetical protein
MEDEDEGMNDEDEHPAEQAEEGEEEDISFANWSAPSWSELIAGLYRPER